jgi:hypothetical protein
MGAAIRRSLLPLWVAIVSVVVGWLVVERADAQREIAKFEEITAHRINVVEADGKPRVVIASKGAMPNAFWKGRETTHQSHGGGGFLFFNDEGTEAGGMGFAAGRSGDVYEAGSNLNFDQYEQDHTLQLLYLDANGKQTVGLRVKDRPNESLFPALDLTERMARTQDESARANLKAEFEQIAARLKAGSPVRFFAGKHLDDSIVELADKRGRPRLRMKVDGAGAASIEFLDEAGTVVQRLQPTK